ncbi:hypothetical protein [Nostoc sp.]
MPHIITLLEQTTFACPTQWVGKTSEDKKVYIRYRFSRLSITIDGVEIANSRIGENLDGVMSDEELINYLEANSESINLSTIADLQIQ